ncbi:ribbon-helix-helix protein, CopG family [bacterium]|nr:ribbon-helix-helix protein, CopG family [bacterium]
MGKFKIKLDSDIEEKLKKMSEAAGYSSPEEFVRHLIEKEVSQISDAQSDEELKKRLQGLGYIS